MLVRKYQGSSLQEIEKKFLQELGSEAIILNVRQIKPKGFRKLFRHPPQLEAIVAVEISQLVCEKTEKRTAFNADLQESTELDEKNRQDIESLKKVKAHLLHHAPDLLKGKM